MTLEKKFIKLICIAFVGIIIILPLSACSEKEFIDKDRFVMYAKNESFETHDLTEAYASIGEFENVKEVIKKYDWSMYFYTLKNVEAADSFFDRKIDEFSHSANIADAEQHGICRDSILNRSESFTARTGGKYIYIERVDDKVLCTEVDDRYRAEVDKFVSGL